jgi:3-phenylpropionate/cinnamic acid dioxygenase small subunit
MNTDDYEGIRRALGLYCQLNDDGRFDEWGELLTEDATFRYGDQVEVHGRDDIKAFVSAAQPPELRGKHVIMNEIIDIAGDAAEVRADFIFFGPAEGGFNAIAANRYHDRLKRSGDQWIFTEVNISLFGSPTS